MARNASALADPAMLSKIDKLFACNVGHYIDLPQIVVVGDQSSGKSSVLEGLTRLPFPRDSGLCTRFATQITFRRSETSSVTVAVLPGKDASQDHIEATRKWKKSDIHALDQSTFADVMREAQAVMGIDTKKGFTSDVLSIEVAGPEEAHLTVIDVPGIFQRVTKDVTTKEDKTFVKNLVLDYMKNPRSVMLTVVPANVDVATQLILEMAEEVDQDGQRTLGVLTKPDLVDKGAEKTVMDMVEGQSHKLRLGWCMVKNPGQQDILNRTFDRYAEEDSFFRTVQPWNRLPMDRLGVEALRDRLQVILAAHIRREFPKVKHEVNAKLEEVKKILKSMGPKRDTPGDQFKFLIDIATHYQTLAAQALDARYIDDCFSEFPVLKIATQAVNREEVFSQDFAAYGHTYAFGVRGGVTVEEKEDSESGSEEEEAVCAPQAKPMTTVAGSAGLAASTAPTSTPQIGFNFPVASGSKKAASLFDAPGSKAPSAAVSTQEASPHPFIFKGQNYTDIVNPKSKPADKPTSKPKAFCKPSKCPFSTTHLPDLLHKRANLFPPKRNSILNWLSTEYLESRGFELGNFSPLLLATTMKTQSENWDSLALGYISDIVYMTDCFLDKLLDLVCPDGRTLDRLKELLADDLLARYKKAFEQVRFILEVERNNMPGTANHYFNDNLEKCRQRRVRNLAINKSHNANGLQVVRVNDVITSMDMSNMDHDIQDLHDILRAYYKVARKRIVDNVINQGGRYWLIMGPNTPIKLFTPAFVSQLSAEKLQDIAGEEPSTRRRRAQLLKEQEDLEKGRKILF
ncbi:hypothetical protein SLS54_009469 [Diplodia seriata]